MLPFVQAQTSVIQVHVCFPLLSQESTSISSVMQNFSIQVTQVCVWLLLITFCQLCMCLYVYIFFLLSSGSTLRRSLLSSFLLRGTWNRIISHVLPLQHDNVLFRVIFFVAFFQHSFYTEMEWNGICCWTFHS